MKRNVAEQSKKKETLTLSHTAKASNGGTEQTFTTRAGGEEENPFVGCVMENEKAVEMEIYV